MPFVNNIISLLGGANSFEYAVVSNNIIGTYINVDIPIKDLRYNKKGNDTKAGTLYSVELSGFIISETDILSDLNYKFFVLKIKSNNGTITNIGTNNLPLKRSSTFDSKNKKGVPGTSFKFSGKSLT